MSLRISGGRRLRSPAGSVARPTAARVRLAVMNLLADRLRGCHWLDPCCGSGVMACEALQRGAARVVAIERDARVAAVARANLEAVAAGIGRSGADSPAPQVAVHGADALHWLAAGATARREERFDVIYLDPPWAEGLHQPLSLAVRRGGWLRQGGLLIWEHPSSSSPLIPEGWQAGVTRRYGAASVLLLEQEDADPPL